MADFFAAVGFVVEDDVGAAAPEVGANGCQGHVRGYELWDPSVGGLR